MSAWPYGHHQASPHLTAASSPIDLYYRQAAAAAVLQKPLSYRMYPSMATASTIPLTPTPLTHLSASNSLSSLSNYYQTATQQFGSTNSPVCTTSTSSNATTNTTSLSTSSTLELHEKSPQRTNAADVTEETQNFDSNRKSIEILDRSPSPQLNPGSPPEKQNNYKKLSYKIANNSNTLEVSDNEDEEHDVVAHDDEDDAAIEV